MKVAIQAKLKNGILFEAAKKLGSASALAAHLGLSATELGSWMNFAAVPRPLRTIQKGKTLKRDYEAISAKLYILTGHTLEEIFPDEIRGEKFLKQKKRVEAIVDMPIARLVAAGAVPQLPPAPDDLIFQEDRTQAILDMLATLTPQEGKVIRMRYGLLPYDGEHTQSEIADEMKLCRDRICKIEKRAIQKLRHPARSKDLKPLMGEEHLGTTYVLAPTTGEQELYDEHRRREEEEWERWRAEARREYCQKWLHDWQAVAGPSSSLDSFPVRCGHCDATAWYVTTGHDDLAVLIRDRKRKDVQR